MATQVQFRRGNTYNMSNFTGANGEVVVDTDKETVVVHDGVTVGGFPVARESNTILRGSNSQFLANQYFSGTYHYVQANAIFAAGLNSSNLNVANSSAVTNVFVNTSTIFVGNSSANLIANSTTVSIGGVLVANSSGTNNAFFLGGVPATSFQTTAGLSANVATLTSYNTLYVGAVPVSNVVTTPMLSNIVFTLTSNNTSYVGTVAAANVVSNSQLSSNLSNYVSTTNLTNNLANYQTTAGLNANVSALGYINTAASYTITGVHTYSSNVTVNGTLAVNTVIALNGSNGTAGYVLTSNGNSNVYWSIPGVNASAQYIWSNNQTYQGNVSFSNYIFGTYVNATSYTTGSTGTGTGGVSTNTTTIVIGNNTINTNITSAGLSVNAVTIANSSGVYASVINASSGIYGTLQTASQPNITANNTSFVGTVSAANVVSNAQLSSNLSNYQTTAGLSANVATLAANNASYLGGTAAGSYQTTLGLSANIATLTSNNTSFVGTVAAANVVSNAQLSSNLSNYQTTAGLSANIASYLPTYNGTVNAASFNVGTTVVANSSGTYDSLGNLRSIPIQGKTSSYQLASSDNGTTVSTNSGITVNGAVLSTSQAFTIFNNSSSSITITQGSGVTMYYAGNAVTGNRTLANYGVATILMVASNTFVISGAGLT